MPKYSTGGGAGGSGGRTCELCGEPADDLRTATVAGAELDVCGDCAPHSDTAGDQDESGDRSESERKRRAAHNTARQIDAASNDPSYWVEEGTEYEDDQLPYLVTDYGAKVVDARREAGLQREELAEELGIDDADLLAVEQGRAARANVGGSVIAVLEEYLDIDLVEE